MSSIKAHAQTISVIGLFSSTLYGIAKGVQLAVETGNGDYILYTVGGIWFLWAYYLVYRAFRSVERQK